MAIQTTTTGRNSEYHGESVTTVQSGSVVHLLVKTGVILHKDYNNMPAPAIVEFNRAVRPVVYKQTVLPCRVAQQSKRIGVTEIILDVFREHVYRYGLGQQQPQPFNNQYYSVDILPKEDIDKTKFLHLRNNKTPAEMCGVMIEGDNKWKT